MQISPGSRLSSLYTSRCPILSMQISPRSLLFVFSPSFAFLFGTLLRPSPSPPLPLSLKLLLVGRILHSRSRASVSLTSLCVTSRPVVQCLTYRSSSTWVLPLRDHRTTWTFGLTRLHRYFHQPPCRRRSPPGLHVTRCSFFSRSPRLLI